MSRVFWDTNIFIYLFEDPGERGQRAAQVRSRMVDRGDQLYTSAFTLGELLVKPLESGDRVAFAKYDDTIRSQAVLLPFDVETAATYAAIRRDRTIRAPDAIQLACAAVARVDLFITNDARLSNKVIPGIQFVVPLAQAFL